MKYNYSSTQTKVLLFLVLLLSLLFLRTSSADAASIHYVRPGASGSNNGSDWTNAYTNLPTTLTRGDTYYIASGNYGSSINGVNTARSGTTPIYIKKCPASTDLADACQSVSGWSNSYGTGQAFFNNTTVDGSSPGYIDIDGMTSYGIKIDVPDVANANGIFITSSVAPGFKLKHIEFTGHGTEGNAWGVALVGVSDSTGLLISHCSIHGMNTPIYFAGVNNAIIEYNDMYDIVGLNHPNMMWIGNPAHDLTIRYNKFHNYSAEGIFLTYWNGGTSSSMYNFYIYGNLFYDGYFPTGSDYPRGIELRDGDGTGYGTYGNVLIYNNTCADMNLGCVINNSGSNGGGVGATGEIRNNIGYGGNSGFNVGNMTNSNNTVVSSSSQFVNYAARDFHLASATAAGYTLSSPYNADMDGNTRGSDGVWDLGAYEYKSGSFAVSGSGVREPAPPKNLSIQ